jgi:hypothetical protein
MRDQLLQVIADGHPDLMPLVTEAWPNIRPSKARQAV